MPSRWPCLLRPTQYQEDDVQLRELTCDPKFRRVLVTDGRNATGQAMARAMAAQARRSFSLAIADPWKPFPGRRRCMKSRVSEIVALDITDSQSVADVAGEIAHRVDILVNTSEHPRIGGISTGTASPIAREEMDIRYFGLLRLAQHFGPTMRARGADGVNAAAAFVNLLSVHALMNWPPYGAFSAAEAACLSAAQALRAELRGGGVKVLNMFAGPLETEWFQSVPPPKLSPAALASATVDALRAGIEDAYVGDIAQDIRARLEVQPKAVERELGAMSALAAFAAALATGLDSGDRPHPHPDAGISHHRHAARARPMRAVPHGGDVALRRARPGLVLEQFVDGRAYRHPFRCADPLGLRQGTRRTTRWIRSRRTHFIAPACVIDCSARPPPTPISC